jgi:hypothetical protein
MMMQMMRRLAVGGWRAVLLVCFAILENSRDLLNKNKHFTFLSL